MPVVIKAILMIMLTAAPADTPLSLLGREEIACPLCRQRFAAVLCTQSNIRGGVDRDLFARALGPQPEYYRICSCPRCGYSGYLTDFAASVVIPPDVRDKILKAPRLPLPAGFTPASDPRELDAAIRYDLAITCYQWLGKTDEALGWLHLRASWIARDEGAVLPPDDRLKRVMKFAERWRPTLPPGGNQLDVEMRTASAMGEALALGRFNRYQRPYVELALTLILRQHGENRQAAPRLERLTQYERFAPPLRQAITRMRASITKERQYQEQAVRHFERALPAEQIAPANRAAASYLLGELHRRLGHDAAAVRWYEQALQNPALEPELRAWAGQQRDWCRSAIKQDMRGRE